MNTAASALAANRVRAEPAALFARVLEGLPLEGAERSFKMSAGSLLAERYLAGVRREALTALALSSLCGQLQMPDDYLEALLHDLPEADSVHFGYEAGEAYEEAQAGGKAGCVYKIYLEFWQRLNQTQNASAPVLLHLAYKWDVQSPGRRAVSEYRCFPGLSAAQAMARMEALYGADGGASLAASRALVGMAARLTREPLMYLEVSEPGNPRASFDIRLYAAQLRLKDAHPALLRVSRVYDIADAFDALYAQQREGLLGHLSGGVDRAGSDFLTVYTPGEQA